MSDVAGSPAEAAVPFSVLGLWALQRPATGWLGLLGAAGYAYTFVFFPGTVVYALVRDVADWQALQDDLGAWLTVHGILMVVTGACFAVAVVRAGVLPRWTGVALFLGLALIAVASGMSDVARTAAAGVRDLAIVGMGAAVLRSPTWS